MADKVTMKALDTMHMSNVRADNLVEGDVFLVTEAEAKALEERGLAERGGTAAKAVNAEPVGDPNPDSAAIKDAADNASTDLNAGARKAIAASPENKMMAEPENKAAPAKRTTAKRK